MNLAKAFKIYKINNIFHNIINEIHSSPLSYYNNNNRNIIHLNYNLKIIRINITKVLNIIGLSNSNNNFIEKKCNYFINKKQNYLNFQKIIQIMIGITLYLMHLNYVRIKTGQELYSTNFCKLTKKKNNKFLKQLKINA